MPNKRISTEEKEVQLLKIMKNGTVSIKTITADIKKLEKAMRLQEQVRKKHAAFINSAFEGIKADRSAGEKQAPNFRNSGRPKAKKGKEKK